LAFARSTGKALSTVLIDGWGFPNTRGNVHFVYNGNVTRKEIERNFEILLAQIDEKLEGDDCYIKLHFMGHGFKWKGGDDRPKNQTPQKNPEKDHIGFEVSPSDSGPEEDVYWDYEMVEQLNKVSAALKKKGKKSALIAQADFCWAQGIFGDLATTPASNMFLAWSAAKDKQLCQKPTPEQPTPFTQGFIDAFQGKNPTVQNAHKSATQAPQIKDMDPGSASGSSDGVSPKK